MIQENVCCAKPDRIRVSTDHPLAINALRENIPMKLFRIVIKKAASLRRILPRLFFSLMKLFLGMTPEHLVKMMEADWPLCNP